MKLVKLITCDNATQAHIIRGALQNEGIDSMLRNENMATLMAGWQVDGLTGVDILVDEKDYEAAICLLERNQMIPEQLRYCPFCGSPDIKFELRKGCRLRAIVAASLPCLRVPPRGLTTGSTYVTGVKEGSKSRLPEITAAEAAL